MFKYYNRITDSFNDWIISCFSKDRKLHSPHSHVSYLATLSIILISIVHPDGACWVKTCFLSMSPGTLHIEALTFKSIHNLFLSWNYSLSSWCYPAPCFTFHVYFSRSMWLPSVSSAPSPRTSLPNQSLCSIVFPFLNTTLSFLVSGNEHWAN